MIIKSEIMIAANQIREKGFVVLDGNKLMLSEQDKRDLDVFIKNWEFLELDNYLPNQGKYRFRQYSRVQVSNERRIRLLPHQPYYQSRELNSYMGGIMKEFTPVPRDILNNDFFVNTLLSNIEILNEVTQQNNRNWEVGIHFFRVTCAKQSVGIPTPGGLHQDGVDFVTVQLFGRRNITGGMSRIADSFKRIVYETMLKNNLDRIIIDDRIMFHEATLIDIEDTSIAEFGYRDILNMDYKIC